MQNTASHHRFKENSPAKPEYGCYQRRSIWEKPVFSTMMCIFGGATPAVRNAAQRQLAAMCPAHRVLGNHMLPRPISRAERIMHLKFFPGHIYRQAFQSVRTKDKIGMTPRSDRSHFFLKPQRNSRSGRGCQNSLILRDTKGNSFSHAVKKMGSRSGNCSVRKSGQPTLQINLLPSQCIYTVPHSQAPKRIRDQTDPIRKKFKCQAHRTGVNMQTIANQFRHHIFPLTGSPNGPWMPMVNTGHGIEQMRYMRSARLKKCGSLLIGTIRMSQ